MNINNYINPAGQSDKSEILHSSGHARVAQGSSIGSTNVQPFTSRLQLMKRSREVGTYQRSQLGSQFGVHQQVTSRETITPPNRPQTSQSSQHRFVEPPKRGYNPYA